MDLGFGSMFCRIPPGRDVLLDQIIRKQFEAEAKRYKSNASRKSRTCLNQPRNRKENILKIYYRPRPPKPLR